MDTGVLTQRKVSRGTGLGGHQVLLLVSPRYLMAPWDSEQSSDTAGETQRKALRTLSYCGRDGVDTHVVNRAKARTTVGEGWGVWR